MTFSYLPPAGVRTELVEFDSGGRRVNGAVSVSYTHLTLPTILRV